MLDGGTGLIRLGSLFDSSKIDPVRETISFTSPHGFNDGDCVFYDARTGGSMIVGSAQANEAPTAARRPARDRCPALLRPGHRQTTIQLTLTYDAAIATNDVPLTVTPGTPTVAGDPTPLTLNGGTPAIGSQLIYRAPLPSRLPRPSVNVTLTSSTAGRCPGPRPGPRERLRRASDWTALNIGDAVRYASTSPSDRAVRRDDLLRHQEPGQLHHPPGDLVLQRGRRSRRRHVHRRDGHGGRSDDRDRRRGRSRQLRPFIGWPRRRPELLRGDDRRHGSP